MLYILIGLFVLVIAERIVLALCGQKCFPWLRWFQSIVVLLAAAALAIAWGSSSLGSADTLAGLQWDAGRKPVNAAECIGRVVQVTDDYGELYVLVTGQDEKVKDKTLIGCNLVSGEEAEIAFEKEKLKVIGSGETAVKPAKATAISDSVYCIYKVGDFQYIVAEFSAKNGLLKVVELSGDEAVVVVETAETGHGSVGSGVIENVVAADPDTKIVCVGDKYYYAKKTDRGYSCFELATSLKDAKPASPIDVGELRELAPKANKSPANAQGEAPDVQTSPNASPAAGATGGQGVVTEPVASDPSADASSTAGQQGSEKSDGG